MTVGVSARPGSTTELPVVGLQGNTVRLDTTSSTAIVSTVLGSADSVTIVNKHSQPVRAVVTYAVGTNDGFTPSNRAFLVDANGAHDVGYEGGNPIASVAVDVPNLALVAAGSSVAVDTLPSVNPSANGYVFLTFSEK